VPCAFCSRSAAGWNSDYINNPQRTHFGGITGYTKVRPTHQQSGPLRTLLEYPEYLLSSQTESRPAGTAWVPRCLRRQEEAAKPGYEGGFDA
jgi:hypothetical protein